ncbi:two-component system, CitB family, sensor histidine kinase DctS [Carboxydocella sporoproducens DSM 16521]|uniref:histidine kinase n=2 Tax=Carboxydocella TaxID=178898 RepID=A0A1T4N4T9_9FIRM|nr:MULTISPECIES: sensor histidine kinase [Carboxydocella]AVX20912.1 two-component system, CitB family, sensor histidine kinase DctS [Carboxydocella thermautotrophica]GAW29926.1 hypothetical protein ULO1_24960 [Carboxydocella sp. ULO1]SJZ74370.1 two-component system, CitB family, sensor histidine kinase DctS [Carboxydocella sporoproducens DSM 16521]
MTIRLRTKMTLLAFLIVMFSVTIVAVVVSWQSVQDFRSELGRRALAIGRTVAQSPLIQQNVGRPGAEKIIQPYVERIRLATNVDYIVVLDMNKKRLSHPVANRIGTIFAGGDEGPAFADNEYTSLAVGVNGEAVRAFVPIKDERGIAQVGVVVVGILTPSLGEVLLEWKSSIYLTMILALFAGAIGAFYLAAHVKQAIFGLEPEEIAALMEEREAILAAINEGIIAIDRENRITLINPAARQILGIAEEELLGRPINEVIPNTALPEVISTGSSQFNQELVFNRKIIVSNRLPIRWREKIIGAVAVFRDKSEVRRLAEELTGVKKFVEALRVQNHENLNKLHTIAGLIQLHRYQEALDYIFRITEQQQEITAFLTRQVKDPAIAGLLLGKMGRAKELNIRFELDRKSELKTLPANLTASDIVLIMGNLLENAMEAVLPCQQEKRWVKCGIKQDQKELILWVADGGPGLIDVDFDRYFQLGYSTKRPEGRGLGLYLIKQQAENAGGKIILRSRPQQGTLFLVKFSYEGVMDGATSARIAD